MLIHVDPFANGLAVRSASPADRATEPGCDLQAWEMWLWIRMKCISVKHLQVTADVAGFIAESDYEVYSYERRKSSRWTKRRRKRRQGDRGEEKIAV